jgi:hypothetical protein
MPSGGDLNIALVPMQAPLDSVSRALKAAFFGLVFGGRIDWRLALLISSRLTMVRFSSGESALKDDNCDRTG